MLTPDANGIIKYVLVEGSRDLIEKNDEVFYKHETRFDNGQLVDLTEKRKAIDKFEMSGALFLEFYKIAMKSMRKGEIAWIQVGKDFHKGSYFTTTIYKEKNEE